MGKPKPVEFGEAWLNWENVGWRVKVAFTTLVNKVRPKDHMEVLRALLPSRYSPLQPNGNGIQSICLTEVSPTFAEVLAGLIGQEAQALTGRLRSQASIPLTQIRCLGRRVVPQPICSGPNTLLGGTL